MSYELPLVSVVMPTYNHAQFIEESIESVINQTYSNFELIIIDNYSDDDTEKKVNEYLKKDNRIIYRKYSNNGIIAASRNKGMEIAKGKHIAFLDSDDLWINEKLEKQVKFLEENPEVFLIYSKFYIKKDNEIIGVGPKYQKMYRGYAFNKLFTSIGFIGCLTVMIRNITEGEKYYFNTDKELVSIEDYELWVRISKKHKIDYIDEPLSVYRLHKTNVSADLNKYYKKNMHFMKLYKNKVSMCLLIKRYLKFYIIFISLFLYRKLIKFK